MIQKIKLLWYSFWKAVLPPQHIANTTPSELDKRDFVASVPRRTLPESFHIDNIPPIKDQGAIGSCRSHSIIREYEIQLNTKMKSTGRFDGSELFHYYMARKYVQKTFPKDSGMSMRAGCQTALKFGVCPEDLYPYDVANMNKEPDEFAKGIGDIFRIKRYERLLSIQAIKQSVFEGIPVGVGIYVDDSFYRYKSGYWAPTTKKYGHAVTIVGWTAKGFYINNSWGTAWGRSGSFFMTYEDFEKWSFDWYRMILGE